MCIVKETVFICGGRSFYSRICETQQPNLRNSNEVFINPSHRSKVISDCRDFQFDRVHAYMESCFHCKCGEQLRRLRHIHLGSTESRRPPEAVPGSNDVMICEVISCEHFDGQICFDRSYRYPSRSHRNSHYHSGRGPHHCPPSNPPPRYPRRFAARSFRASRPIVHDDSETDSLSPVNGLGSLGSSRPLDVRDEPMLSSRIFQHYERPLLINTPALLPPAPSISRGRNISFEGSQALYSARLQVSDDEDPDDEDHQNLEVDSSLSGRHPQFDIDLYQLPSAASDSAEKVAEELQVPSLNVLNTQVPFRLFQRLFAFELIRTVKSSKWATSTPMPIPKQLDSKVIDGDAESSCTENMKQPKSRGYYRELQLTQKEIRLFKLFPSLRGDQIQASFVYTDLSTCPAYTALSYTWGEDTGKNLVKILGSSTVSVRANLWDFLCQQASELTEPKLFWIDAVCIDQDDTHERNHQVKIMKEIYVNAVETYVWLGKGANGSDQAMDFIRLKGTVGLRPKGTGFHNMWKKEQGQGLCELLARPYWRRMWIVQEVTHSQKITVGCGGKTFNWESLEAFYLTLKELEDSNWLFHHEYAMQIFQSPACTMVWQRAYWRHPETSTPALTDLVELFQEWKCTDVRDKVYALVNMASSETRIEPDYSSTPRDVFLAVRDKHPASKPHFFSLLFQMLGIPGREVDCHHLTMIEYKVESPESVLLRRKWREHEHRDVTFDNGKFDGE